MSGWVNSGKNSASGRNLVICPATGETIFKDQAMEDCLSDDLMNKIKDLDNYKLFGIPIVTPSVKNGDHYNLATGKMMFGRPDYENNAIYTSNMLTKGSPFFEDELVPFTQKAKDEIRLLGLNQKSYTKSQVLRAAAIASDLIGNSTKKIKHSSQSFLQSPKCTDSYVQKYSISNGTLFYVDLNKGTSSYEKPDDNCALYKFSKAEGNYDHRSLIPINQAAINETEAAKKKIAKNGKKSKAQQWNQPQQQWNQQQEWERQQQQQEWERQQQQQEWERQQQQQQQQEWERQQQQQEWERQQQQQEWERQQQQEWERQQQQQEWERQQQQQQQPQQTNSDDHMFTVSRRLGNALQQGKFIAHLDGYDNGIPEFSIKGSFKQSGGKKYRKNKTRKNKLRKNKTRHGRSRKN